MADREKTRAREQGALSQLGALRDHLASSNPEFAAAALVEREAEALCDRIRTDLKSHRLALKLNQQELAERVDLSQSAISKVESGPGDLSLKTVFRIAAALGLDPVVTFAPANNKIAEKVGPAETAVTAAALVEAVKEGLIRQIPEIVEDAVARRMTVAE